MKGFSLPNISMPNVSIPKISIDSGLDAGAIIGKIESTLPDISDLISGVDIEGIASEILSEAMGDELELPPELSSFLK